MTGYRMHRCHGGELHDFEHEITEPFVLGSHIYNIVGYHWVENTRLREFECWACLELFTGEGKKDIRLDDLKKQYDAGVIHEADPLYVLAKIGNMPLPPGGKNVHDGLAEEEVD